jgi:hypothetical protein
MHRKRVFSVRILGIFMRLVVTQPARGAGVQMCQDMWRNEAHILASIESTNAKGSFAKATNVLAMVRQDLGYSPLRL